MNKLSIILIHNCNNIDNSLNNIFNQTFINFEVFIITYTKNLKLPKLTENKIHIIEPYNNFSIFNELISLSASLPGDFITFMNSSDINAFERFEKQILFMNLNNLNICSCLEMPLHNNIQQKQALIESNNFITSDDINSVISASYLPLDLYTFVFRKSFFIKILYYSSYYFFTSEIDLILYFLRFENISKIPEVLYYVDNPKIPYDECLNYYLGPNTSNKLAIFNENKTLDNQYYFNEIINSRKKTTIDNKKYKYTIVSILNYFNIGGTESYIINLAKKLKEENINLCILTNKCFNKEVFAFYNIEFHVLNLYNKNELTTTILSINNIKVIQIHMNEDINLCKVIKSIIDVPLVLTIHGIYYSQKLLSNYLSYIDKVVFVSDYSKKYYSQQMTQLSFKENVTIPNGIENSIKYINYKNILRNTLKIQKNSIIILYCSRLSYNKSNLAMLFLESFKNIAKKNKKIFAVIIGHGNYYKQINELSYNINLELKENKIFTLANRFNIFDYYNDSDLIIGTGRVALEAMSIGKPVISFGSNGEVNIVNKNTIEKMINSNFGDHSSSSPKFDNKLIIEKLSTSINLLINSKEKSKKLGNWNKFYVEKHLSLDAISKFYIKLCENENFNE